MALKRETKIISAALGAISATAAILALRAPRASRPYRLRDKVVLITGGSRGLGLVLAREYLHRGSIVAVCARNQDELSSVKKEFASFGHRFLALQCDLSDNDQVLAMVQTLENELGPVNVLVNNAGTMLVGPLENQRIEDFKEVMQMNFWSAVHTTFAVIPGMRRRGSGRIVNITSVGGKLSVPHLLSYSASKFAFTGFSKGLRAELAKDGISVTTVIPGLMRTGSPRNVEVTGQHAKEYSWFILADSFPGLSMDARRAAREVVEACVSGTGEVVLGVPAKFAVMADAIASNMVGAVLAAVNQRLLPAPGNGVSRKKGSDNENIVTKSLLTSLTRRAELENNER